LAAEPILARSLYISALLLLAWAVLFVRQAVPVEKLPHSGPQHGDAAFLPQPLDISSSRALLPIEHDPFGLPCHSFFPPLDWRLLRISRTSSQQFNAQCGLRATALKMMEDQFNLT
jgi:hypothetical protein